MSLLADVFGGREELAYNDCDIEDLIISRGFNIMNYGTGEIEGRKTKVSINSVDKYHINLSYYPQSDDWELTYIVPRTFFTFNTGKLGSFSNEEHFNKFYKKFKKEVIECWSNLEYV